MMPSIGAVIDQVVEFDLDLFHHRFLDAHLGADRGQHRFHGGQLQLRVLLQLSLRPPRIDPSIPCGVVRSRQLGLQQIALSRQFARR